MLLRQKFRKSLQPLKFSMRPETIFQIDERNSQILQQLAPKRNVTDTS